MDSYRLTINNYDLSTSNIEQAEEISGFTVVKAPKGSITPRRIPAAGTAKIQDIFGVASANYPELYEAINFNSEYDLYISAPYTKAEVPFATITSLGILPADTLMSYNTKVEGFIEGVENDINIPDSVDSLIDSRYPINYFGIDNYKGEYSDLYDKQAYPGVGVGSDTKTGIVIETGLYLNQFPGYVKTGNTESLSEIKFKVKNLPVLLNNEDYFELSFIASNNFIDVKNGNDIVGSLVYLNANEKYEKLPIESAEDTGNSNVYNTPCVIKIDGVDLGNIEVAGKLSTKYVAELATDRYLKKLRTYWKKTIQKDDIKGLIFPKYPSERALHISFEGFNENKGYSSTSADSRNTLKMAVYEDGAFHDISHPLSIIGSLDISAKDANNAYIGFSNNNITYADQELLCVYSVDNQGFTEEDEEKFKKIKRYPAIVLDGGIREFNVLNGEEVTESYNPITFHNLGWEVAKNEEYSNVRIFFDSCCYDDNTDSSVENEFFNLGSIHTLAGFIFNQTLTPVAVLDTLPPLSYGENYWNTCNKAIVNLSNNDKILSPITGSKSLMQCRIIKNNYGGVAPMYLNSGTPSVGGQLNIPGLFKMKYKYTTEQQRILDELNYNPIIQDHSYGALAIGQKTCKPGAITDWSYIGHVCAFLDFQRDVKVNVMVDQLGKPNNEFYRTLRAEQVRNLLEKRINGSNNIWAEGVVDTSTADGINDIQTQRARQFKILVRVKVSVFSEYVTLDFVNLDQSMTA